MPTGHMVLLTTVPNAFTAKVLAARLGSEGLLWELRGNVDGPYPVGVVQVLVAADDLVTARELLLADEIEASYDEGWDDDADAGGAGALRAPVSLWFVVLGIVSISLVSLGRLVIAL